MGLTFDVSIPALTVFVQGLLSFLSPCVLPLLPLYIGYLSGGAHTVDAEGKEHYPRGKVMLNTLFFCIGISFTFFLLGLGASALGGFLQKNQTLFARIGGILVLLFGLYQLGVFGSSKLLGKERRMPFHLDTLAMSPLTALLMGFTFSFAWTPCVGPVLTSVLVMTASASTRMTGMLLIGVYTLGFILPFLAVGLFTTSLLGLFRKHRNVVKYTVKVGGVLMVLMGLMMFTGKMNDVTGYLSSFSSGTSGEASRDTESSTDTKNSGDSADAKDSKDSGDSADAKDGKDSKDNSKAAENDLPDAVDFRLEDQYGQTHRLSDYKGKTVFLNFWATWCPPCRAEMPDIQKLYEEYSKEEDPEVVILGIAGPDQGREGSREDIEAFLEENGYTYPVVMDETGEMFQKYGVSSLPTTYMITAEGKVFGYVGGGMTEDMMRSIISQTLEGKRK